MRIHIFVIVPISVWHRDLCEVKDFLSNLSSYPQEFLKIAISEISQIVRNIYVVELKFDETGVIQFDIFLEDS